MNKELLKQTLEAIKANPQHWDQKAWHCGTSHCFAGFAELIHRGLPINYDVGQDAVEWINEDDSWTTESYAQQFLELDEDDAHNLFDACNTLDELQRIVQKLLDRS